MQSTIRSHDFKNRVPKSNSENDDGKNYKAWMLSVKDTLGNVNERPRNLSIYKVPNKLRRVKEDAYNPHLVSIGPFHASKQKLVAMKEHKWRYMLHFLHRVTPHGTNYNVVTSPAEAPLEECTKATAEDPLEECAKAISELEEVARACYAENINLDKNQLAQILLVDGCFILELFIKHADQNQDQDEEEEELDPIINNLWMVPTLQHDLALLENQIPFVVLQTLFDTIQKLANMQFRFSLKKYVLLFFRSALNLSDKAIQYTCTADPYTCTADPLHIADLLHRVVYTPPSNRNTKEKIEWGFKRCATQLVESGIQFQPAVDKDRLLDIRFHEGVIIIPPLHIQEITDSVFRNLVAFEQCSVGCSLHMTSYAWLMKILIRSSKDAELLRLKGIITNEVGGDEKVSTFFQSLCREIVFNDFYFSDLCEEVNSCKKSWLRWGRIKASVKDRLDVLIQRQGNLSIYKVPNKLRRLKEDAYNPHLVSIGAFHASNHELVVMKEHKWHYMLHFLRRAEEANDQGNKHNALEECGKAISELEEVARACYDENIDLDDHQLVEILLVDGCFILELFIKHYRQNPDPIINNLWMVPTLQHDLALLENQIPFVVLQTLLNTVQKLANMQFRFSLKKYVLLFFRSALNLSDETIQYRPTSDLLHIVDLLHRVVYTPPSNRNPARNLEGQEEIERGFKRCATKLVKSGIQFQRGVDKDRRLLDITFNRGVITIPPLHIQEITGSVFRNLVAFEQCSVGCSCHMASYAWLMKTLICSSQDAELLRLKGIITNEVGGDEEVSTFFQSLCREVVVKDFCFCELCDEVNKYDKSWLHWGRIKAAVKVRWKGYIETLHNDYFNSPWTIISFFAALVLLCLTALQTYYSARSYYPR